MMNYQERLKSLAGRPHVWAVTGVAGFIGSNLLQRLLSAGQHVVGLENFATGHRRNLAEVEHEVGAQRWANFRLIEGDIRDPDFSRRAFEGVDYVVHQAALGSVPLSLERPEETHAVNVTGFIHVLQAARAARVRRLVYASSCAVYGDDAGSPKVEDRIGHSISPYATSKQVNELYAAVFERCYGLSTVGLRYFNVYGPRQDPHGSYAAVIPKWFDAVLRGEPVHVYGDGRTSRDFVFVQDVVQANILAATADLGPDTAGLVCNCGTGVETSLNELFAVIRDVARRAKPGRVDVVPVHGDARPGDIRHSCADIRRARHVLGYNPQYDLAGGLRDVSDWCVAQARRA